MAGVACRDHTFKFPVTREVMNKGNSTPKNRQGIQKLFAICIYIT
jgi:hypothetical protein